ncbi:hypothetical protein ORI20_06645 [Mycobacterium sp. CVI_P3]|uniref:DUF4267 domain-containing protein n=1 Tax=Mycobacterium pinniadriaticum TaxID=2994102 RepID=A0ABT3SA96_9MYCO|nr:hypothetical protein [Mycobacterium pinniadriaticum]MCX2929943.1 hypothetical protein [Mycobacterium pinniadriaticum]MCX2936408.1 hypothetical protein [Mycobacterium pinniadriaticum]
MNILSTARTAIGASGWFMPITAGKLFGIDASNDVSAALYLRLGGTRDFALAAGPLVTAGPARGKLLAIAAGCDLADIAAVAVARRNDKISSMSAALFSAASLACLTLSVKAIADVKSSTRSART